LLGRDTPSSLLASERRKLSRRSSKSSSSSRPTRTVNPVVCIASLQRTTDAINDGAQRLSRYFLAQTALNVMFGLVVGIALALIGVPNPVLSGILAMVFRAKRQRQRAWGEQRRSPFATGCPCPAGFPSRIGREARSLRHRKGTVSMMRWRRC
jgi:hypothetical protein